MKYILLIHQNERAWAQLSDADKKQMMGEFMKLTGDLMSSGRHLGGSRLQPTSTARSVRVRDGKRLVTDGPFAETREQLGGFYLIDAADLDEAIDIAARIPAARVGTIEIRPVVEAGAQATV